MLEKYIVMLRGHRVMLSTHLAELYGVQVRALVQSVKRNKERFPEDFMFQLTKEEYSNLKSQIVTSSWGGMRRANPYAFTEQGVAMLSSVLKSKTAVNVNIQIIRTFIKLRELLITNELIRQKMDELERKYEKHDKQFKAVFEALRELLEPPKAPKKKPIGFHVKY